MAVEFEVVLHAFEDDKPSFDRHVQFRVGEFAEAIALSQRMTEEFAHGYHMIENPTPTELSNVMCNELFHLMREDDTSDTRKIVFMAGCVLRLCALPDDAPSYRGLGRHPAAGERVYLTIQRVAAGEGRYGHNCIVSTTPPTDA